jgi:3-dehydroquinate synthase
MFTIWYNILKNITREYDFSKYSSIFILTDSNVWPLYLETVIDILLPVNSNIFSYVFPAGEISKNLATVETIYTAMIEEHIDRKSLLLNLGGGVTTDMGGYVASTYMRGIDFCNISTTVEWMVDASVWGKTGVNLWHIKNAVGTFSLPKHIWMDIKMLETLETRAFVQGFWEIIKHGLIVDRDYYELSISKRATEFTPEELVELVKKSVEIKNTIVTDDPREQGCRKLLNFWHTIGHAIESLSLQTTRPLFHGEAVAIGMVVESKISELMGFITENEYQNIYDGILRCGLPVDFTITSDEAIFELMQHDKKTEKKNIKWSLLEKIGKGNWDQKVPTEIVKKALQLTLLN